MQTYSIRALILTGAALTFGAAAHAEIRFTANIPFSFRVNGAVLPAGNYNIGPAMHGAPSAVQLTGTDTKKAALALVTGVKEGESGDPRLTFHCGEITGCVLIQVADAQGYVWAFPKPRFTAAEKERLAVVNIHQTSADY